MTEFALLSDIPRLAVTHSVHDEIADGIARGGFGPCQCRDRMTLTKLTDIYGWEHLVNDEAMLLGRFTGHYVTLCGWAVDPVSMTSPPGRPCFACHKSLLA